MTDFQNLQSELQRQRGALLQRLDAIRGDFAQGRSADSEDQAQERENDEALSAIESETERELALIDRSLSKLARGHYGFCENCGKEISPQRMSALPYATHCIHCAQGEHHAH